MAKVIKNTTGTDIFISESGQNIPASGQLTIDPALYYLWAKPETITEITTAVNSGNLVINNGTIDLPSADGLRFLQFPERLTVQQSAVDITRTVTTINFVGSATVSDNTGGSVTVNVGAKPPALREVTMVNYGSGFINTDSALLFESDPVNDTILFLKEQ